MNRNIEIRRIIESREIARRQIEQSRKVQQNRDRRLGGSPGLDPENLYVRDSRFPWK